MFKSKTTTNFKCQNYYRKLNKLYFMSFLFFFFFFGLTTGQLESECPKQESNPSFLHWKHGLLITGQPGSLVSFFFFKYTVDS